MKKLNLMLIAMLTLGCGTSVQAMFSFAIKSKEQSLPLTSAQIKCRLENIYNEKAITDGSWVSTTPDFKNASSGYKSHATFLFEKLAELSASKQNKESTSSHFKTINNISFWQKVAGLGSCLFVRKPEEASIQTENIPITSDQIVTAMQNHYGVSSEFSSEAINMNLDQHGKANLYKSPRDLCVRLDRMQGTEPICLKYDSDFSPETIKAHTTFKTTVINNLQLEYDITQAQRSELRWKVQGITTVSIAAAAVVGAGLYCWTKTSK